MSSTIYGTHGRAHHDPYQNAEQILLGRIRELLPETQQKVDILPIPHECGYIIRNSKIIDDQTLLNIFRDAGDSRWGSIMPRNRDVNGDMVFTIQHCYRSRQTGTSYEDALRERYDF